MFVWILPERKSLCAQLLPTAANVCRSAGRLITPRKELSSLAAIPVSHGRVLLGPWWISYYWFLDGFHTLSITDLCFGFSCPGERFDHIHQDDPKYSDIFRWIWYDLMIWPCACQPVTSQVLDWSPARWWSWNFTSVRAAPWHGQNQIAAQTSQYVHDIVAMFVYHFRAQSWPWHSTTHNATGYHEISESWDPPPGHGMQFQNLIVTGVKGQAKNLGARISKGSQKLRWKDVNSKYFENVSQRGTWPDLGTMTSLSSISSILPLLPLLVLCEAVLKDLIATGIKSITFVNFTLSVTINLGPTNPGPDWLAGLHDWRRHHGQSHPGGMESSGDLGSSRKVFSEVSGGLGFGVRSGNDSRMLSGSGGQLLHDFADSNAAGDARCVTLLHVVTRSAPWNRWNGHIGLLSTLQRTVTVVFFTDYRCTPVIRCDSVIDAHVYRWPYCSAFCTQAQIWQICVILCIQLMFMGVPRNEQADAKTIKGFFIYLSSACWFGSFNVHLFVFTSSIHPHVCKYVNACNCFAHIALRYLAYRDRSSL